MAFSAGPIPARIPVSPKTAIRRFKFSIAQEIA